MVRLWEAGSGRPLATLAGHTGAIRAVALSADSQLVASGGEDGAVRLWEANTGRPLATLAGHAGVVGSVALRPACTPWTGPRR
jgi:WD40 repeat protein